MQVVAGLAAAALVALLAAVLTGSPWPAILVVVLAAAGIVLLLRDWRADRAAVDTGQRMFTDTGDGPAAGPEEFSPDISDRPGGPSSDARSDQI